MKKFLKVLVLLTIAVCAFSLCFACSGGGNPDKTISGITFEDKTYVYDGEEKVLEIEGDLPNGTSVEYTGNTGTNVGTYSATAVVSGTGYKTLTLTADLTITKANYDMSDANWNYTDAFIYDGEEKTVLVENLPNGVTVKNYSNNTATEIGSYTASVEFNYDADNYNEPTIANLNWEITIQELANITFNSATYDYDGSEKSILLSNSLPTGYDVVYSQNKGTNAGTYEASATITGNGINITKYATLTINKIYYDMSNVSWNYTSQFTYDGTIKQVVISGLPTGVNIISYSNNSKTNAGEYTASVILDYDTTNYYEPVVNALTWEINKATYDMSSVSWNYTTPFTYDGTTKEVVLSGLPTGVSVLAYSGNTAVDYGTYTASATLSYDTANYNAPIINSLSWVIAKAQIPVSITFDSLTVEYDTFKHSLHIVGNVPAGVYVKYFYNGVEADGATEVGTYNVIAQLSGPNFVTTELHATLRITSTEEQLYSANLNGTLFFQNNLDGNRLYKLNGSTVTKVSNDVPEYMYCDGSVMYYYSTSLFSKTIKTFNGTKSSTLYNQSGEYLTTDGTYIYYAVNSIFNAENNGIYKLNLNGEDEEPTRICTEKAKWLTYYDGYIYYASTTNDNYLCRISTSATNGTGTILWEEKVEYIIQDSGVLYFNSTAGLLSGSAIRKYIIESATCIKLTTDAGKYLTKVGNYIYYVNDDWLTGTFFGRNICKVSALLTSDNSLPGLPIITVEGNGFSSLTSDGNLLYYYKLNDKHFYAYNESTGVEVDVMASYEPDNTLILSGEAKSKVYNGELYYINPIDDSSLYKYNPTTNLKVKVLADSVADFWFNGDYLYYSTFILTNYALWRLDLTTEQIIKVNSDRCEHLVFDGEYIYYLEISAGDDRILKTSLDGSTIEEIYTDENKSSLSFYKIDGDYYYIAKNFLGAEKNITKYSTSTQTSIDLDLKSTLFIIKNNLIYYFDDDASAIKTANLDGSNVTTLITNVEVNEMIIDGTTLYYASTSSTKKGLYEYNITTATETKITSLAADALCVFNGDLYFINTTVKYSLDYPSQSTSNGETGELYCYNGSTCTKK